MRDLGLLSLGTGLGLSVAGLGLMIRGFRGRSRVIVDDSALRALGRVTRSRDRWL